MEDKKNYVQPPKNKKNYVTPPKKEGAKKNSQDKNSGGAKKNYVAPPKKKQSSQNNNGARGDRSYSDGAQNQYSEQEKFGGRSYNNKAQGKSSGRSYNDGAQNQSGGRSYNDGGQNQSGTRTYNDGGQNKSSGRGYNGGGQNQSGGGSYNDGGQNIQKEKIKTPKMGARFYFSGYLVWMLIFVLFGVQNQYLKILLALYVIASNFTLSWYADYQRYKGGGMSWFFAPFISAKTAAGLSVFMGYRTSKTTRGFLGSYKTKSSRDLGKTASTFFLVSIFIELFKLIINIPLAFVTLFTHQRTLRKYTDLITQHER